MTDLVLDSFSTSNKMAGENFAMLAFLSKKINGDNLARKDNSYE